MFQKILQHIFSKTYLLKRLSKFIHVKTEKTKIFLRVKTYHILLDRPARRFFIHFLHAK